MNALQQQLYSLGACREAVAWAKKFDDPLVAWRACPRGDWLLWVAGKLDIQIEVLVRAACACARLALPYTSDERPLRAIQMAEQWAGGNPRPSLEQVRVAAYASVQAATDAYSYAARAAAYAAEAVASVTRATKAAFAAEAVTEAAADATISPVVGDAARIAMQQKCANIVRCHIDEAIILPLWQKHVRVRQ